MTTKFRINRGEWIEVPEGYVLLKGEAYVREGDLFYYCGEFKAETDFDASISIGEFCFYDGVIRKNENLRAGDFYFEDGSVVEVFNNPRRRHPPYTILKLATPDYEEQDHLRALAEKVDPRFACYRLIVQFWPPPHGGSYAAAFISGVETTLECYDAEEIFVVPKNYTASYAVWDENERVVYEGNLDSSGQYRFHNGMVEKRKGLDWIKPKRFRYNMKQEFGGNKE